MAIDVSIGAPTKGTLQQAILLYCANHPGGSNSQNLYASIHEVNVAPSGVPHIRPGRNLDRTALQKALVALADSGDQQLGLKWAHPHVLATAPGLDCWWTPAVQRWMHFDAPGIQASLPASQPPLVWMRHMGKLLVFALECNERPEPETPLYLSPYMNVFLEGHVCTGSMPDPTGLDLSKVEEAFYASVFTHANPSNRKLVKGRLSNAAFWQQRLKAGPKSAFPVDKLLPAGVTLTQKLDQLMKAG